MQPTDIAYHSQSRVLSLHYADGRKFDLTAEYLRVYSPSAEVRGHGSGQEVLQTGKAKVSIKDIKPVGHYAVQLVFDDGHDTGLYSWDYLLELALSHASRWQDYLQRIQEAGATRDPDEQVIQFDP